MHDDTVDQTTDENGQIIHLDSGVIYDGRLYCAHSNYPGVPMTSSVEIWDAKKLEHIGNHSSGIHWGSCTWVDRYDGYWWAAFAHYDKWKSVTGKGSEWTTVVKFDDHWNDLATWVYPEEVVNRFRPMSNSGGSWGPDGFLYCTGHDNAELYVLPLPQKGSVLDLVEIVPINILGQGIAWDRLTPQQIYGIRKKDRQVVVSKFVLEKPLLRQGYFHNENAAMDELIMFSQGFSSLDEWKLRAEKIREGILRGAKLLPFPERCPLDPIIHSKRNYNGYLAENVAFESLAGFFVTGNLYRPTTGKKPSAHFFGGCNCESGMPIHQSENHVTNNAEIAALAAPRPQLIISDGNDWTRNTAEVEFPYIQNVYGLYGAKDKVENLHLADEGHDYGISKRIGMYNFFARQPGLSVERVLNDDGSIDESVVVIENKEKMLVFDEKHPRRAYEVKAIEWKN